MRVVSKFLKMFLWISIIQTAIDNSPVKAVYFKVNKVAVNVTTSGIILARIVLA